MATAAVSTIHDMADARQRAWHQAREVLDRADNENRAATADEHTQVTALFDEIDRLDAEIRREHDLRDAFRQREKAAAEWSRVALPPTSGSPGDDQLLGQLRQLLAGQRRFVDVDIAPAAAETHRLGPFGTERRRMLTEIPELRALSVGTDTAGGHTVPTGFVRDLYRFLETYSGMRRAGARVVTTTSGEDLPWPVVETGGEAEDVDEGEVIGGTDPVLGLKTLKAYKHGQVIDLTRELIDDSAVDILGFVAEELGRAIAHKSGTKYVNGTGTDQAEGIVTSATTGVTGSDGEAGAPDFDNLIDLKYSVNEAYRMDGAVWFMRDNTVGKVRKLKDEDGQYLWQPALIPGQPDTLLGHPVVTDPYMPEVAADAKSIAFGAFRRAITIRDVSTVRIERSDDAEFKKDMVVYKGVLRTDSRVIDANAVKLFVGGSA